MSPDVNAPVMGPFESSHQHGPPLLGRVRGPTRSPTSSLVCSPPTPSLPSATAPVVPGRWPTLSLVRQGGRRASPGAWAVLFQRAVGSDPAGCASRRAHRVETAIAFRLHNALGTQNERYFVAVNPTAHSLACLRIGVFVTADAARLATGVGGSPFTGRVSHPLDGKQSFMTSPLVEAALSAVRRGAGPGEQSRSTGFPSGLSARVEENQERVAGSELPHGDGWARRVTVAAAHPAATTPAHQRVDQPAVRICCEVGP